MEKEETRSVRFDERRKLLININSETRETELGTIVLRSEATYPEDGIKKVMKNLLSRKEVLEKDIQMLREMSQEPPKMNQELEDLKEKLKILQLIRHHETLNPELKDKEEKKLHEAEEEVKKINKDIEEIKNAIGGRMQI